MNISIRKAREDEWQIIQKLNNEAFISEVKMILIWIFPGHFRMSELLTIRRM